MKKLIALIITLFFIISPMCGCTLTTNNVKNVIHRQNAIEQLKKGTIRHKYGVSFLEVSGTYYEMGLQYGVLLRNEINDVYKSVDRVKESIFCRYPSIIRPFAELILLFKLRSIRKTFPKRYLEELKGMCKGANIPFSNALFVASIPDLFNIGCSSFVMKTPKGIIHGRNLDYYFPEIGSHPTVVEYRPNGKLKYTLIGSVGFLGALSGMNEKGITVSLDASPTARQSKSRATPVTYEIRDILENASDIKDVDNVLRGYKSIKGWLLVIGSSKDNTGVVYNLAGKEWTKSLMNNNYIAVTNYFIDQTVLHKYMTISDATNPTVVSRKNMMEKHLSGTSVNSIGKAINTLINTDFYHYKNVLGAGDVTTNNEGSLQTVVMCPQTKTIYFSSAPTYSGLLKFLSYNIETRRIKIYRQDSPEIKEKSFAEFTNWLKNAEAMFIKNDWKGIAKLTKRIENPTIIQMEGLAEAELNTRTARTDKTILMKLDKVINEYPDYSLLYLLKAEILFEKRQYEKSISSSVRSLESSVNFPYTKMESYKILAESYHELHEIDKAKYYANKCLTLLDSYAIGKREKSIEKKMQSIIRKW